MSAMLKVFLEHLSTMVSERRLEGIDDIFSELREGRIESRIVLSRF